MKTYCVKVEMRTFLDAENKNEAIAKMDELLLNDPDGVIDQDWDIIEVE